MTVEGEGAERTITVFRHVAVLVVLRRCLQLPPSWEALLVSSRKHDDVLTLPKGGWENDEGLLAAALREAYEEAGLNPECDAVVQTRTALGSDDCPACLQVDHVADKPDKLPSYLAGPISGFPTDLESLLEEHGLTDADIRVQPTDGGKPKPATGCKCVTRFHVVWLPVRPVSTADGDDAADTLLLDDFPEAAERVRTWVRLDEVIAVDRPRDTAAGRVKQVFVDILKQTPAALRCAATC
jgi:8-oxo-dGTP pyrophosphatase MutT (NUDIX family)